MQVWIDIRETYGEDFFVVDLLSLKLLILIGW